MIKSICRVDGCEKERHTKSTLCGMHRTRWKTHKSFELPEKNKIPNGFVKLCKVHGFLTSSQCQINKRSDRIKLQIRCKICMRASCVASNKKHIERVRATDNAHYKKTRRRHSDLRRISNFGISPQEYNLMLQKQNNKCAICGQHEKVFLSKTNEIKPLSIDHCHVSGKNRGLLCSKCNIGLGNFQDNINFLVKAIEYLKAHK